MSGPSLRPVLLSLAALALLAAAAQAQSAAISETELHAFTPRPIGPAVTGGRVHDVESLPEDPSVIYVASASGGLWKTTNRGITWTDVWRDMPVSTFGDVAIAATNRAVVYAGTGEQQNRQSTSWGNGVYRSNNGGESWNHLGLEETRHIAKVEVDPRDEDVVWVAALGNLWASSEARGVYKSTDGGQSWSKVLYVDEHTGAIDLELDPSNPDVVFAATYQRQRRTWGFNGGGPGSGIYRTTDGGANWSELGNGIPDGDKGRIGIAISANNPRVLNALIEHASGSGTYRSEDGGATWRMMSDRNPRPMYYSHIYIDPNDDRRVYSLATQSAVSNDGGATWQSVSAQVTYDVGVHADQHDMWIDPSDSDHYYLVGDAGLHETYDGGRTYRRINNFDIGQFYDIGVDDRDPYWVYGGMQDNHSWMGPSQTRRWIGIVNDDWKQTGFGDGMYQQIDPSNPRFAYVNSNGGGYTRVDTETGDILSIRPSPPPGEPRYRFDWVSPSLVSQHDPATVYVGGNRLFTSHNRGSSWTRSEDLTRQIDRDQLEIMGVRGGDIRLSRNDGTSAFGEITTIAESPLTPEVLWVGTDDGNVQVSRNGGATWTEVSSNIAGVRSGTYVSRVQASAAGRGVAYATFDAHRDGDFAPYVFRTDDFGATWRPLHGGLPSGSVNVLVVHPDDANTLVVGTEHHAFVSTDGGGTWAKIPGLPTTAYDDIEIHPREKDIVFGTHGRSIWILDDSSPIAEYSGSDPALHLYSIRRGTIHTYWKDTSYRAQAAYAGTNPRDGVEITYRLGNGADNATLTIRNERGETVRALSVPSGEGMHRVNWDLRWGLGDGVEAWAAHDASVLPRPTESRGHFVSPGTYTVTLAAGGRESTQVLELRGDPLLPITLAQYRTRELFLNDVLDLIERAGGSNGSCGGGGPGGGGGFGAPPTPCRALQQVYQSINGQGIRPGSLYGPTAADRARVEQIRAQIAGRDE